MVFISSSLCLITALLCIQEVAHAYEDDAESWRYDDDNVNLNTNVNDNLVTGLRRTRSARRNVNKNSNLNRNSLNRRQSANQNRYAKDSHPFNRQLFRSDDAMYTADENQFADADVYSDDGDQLADDTLRRNENYNSNTNMNSNMFVRRFQSGRRQGNYNANQNVNSNTFARKRSNRMYDGAHRNNAIKNDARRLQRALTKIRRFNLYRRNIYSGNSNKNNEMKYRRKDDTDDMYMDDSDDDLLAETLQDKSACDGADAESMDHELDDEHRRHVAKNRRYRNGNSLLKQNALRYRRIHPVNRDQLEAEDADEEAASAEAEEDDVSAKKSNAKKKKKKADDDKSRRTNLKSRNVNSNQNFNSNLVAWRETGANRFNPEINHYSSDVY